MNEYLDDISKYLDPAPVNKKTTTGNFDEFIERSAKQNGVDPDLIKRMIGRESDGKPNAKSYKNAQGLMQLMPETASRFGVKDVYDPQQNIEGGTKYFRWLLDRYNGDVPRALVGYNAGEGRADRKDWQKYAERLSNSPNGVGNTSADYYRHITSGYKGNGYYSTNLNSPNIGDYLQTETNVEIGKYFDGFQNPTPVNTPNMSGTGSLEPDPNYMAENGLIADTPEKVQQSLIAYREQVKAEFERAKTPARRKILQTRLETIDGQMREAAKKMATTPAFQPLGETSVPLPTNPNYTIVPGNNEKNPSAPSPTVQGTQTVKDLPTYKKRDVSKLKNGESFYQFEKDGKTENGDEYLGTVGGKHRFKNSDGDELELDEQSKQLKIIGNPKKLKLSDGSEFQRSENQNDLKNGETRYSNLGSDVVVSSDGKIRQESFRGINPPKKLVLGNEMSPPEKGKPLPKNQSGQLTQVDDQTGLKQGETRLLGEDGKTYIAKIKSQTPDGNTQYSIRDENGQSTQKVITKKQNNNSFSVSVGTEGFQPTLTEEQKQQKEAQNYFKRPNLVEAKGSQETLDKGSAGTALVDLAKRPKGENAGKFVLREGLTQIAPKYGLTNEEIESYVASSAGVDYYKNLDEKGANDAVNALNKEYGNAQIEFVPSYRVINEILNKRNPQTTEKPNSPVGEMLNSVPDSQFDSIFKSDPKNKINPELRQQIETDELMTPQGLEKYQNNTDITRQENSARLKTEEEVRNSIENPTFWDKAKNQIADNLTPIGAFKTYLSTFGIAPTFFRENENLLSADEKKARNNELFNQQIVAINREFGNFRNYQKVQDYVSNMSNVEYSARLFGGYVRGVVNTAISSNLKGVDVIDKLIETAGEYNPIYQAIPEKFRPSLRTVENGIGYTIAALLGQGDKFVAAKSSDDVDQRLFYNIGKRVEEFLGDDKYLKKDFGYKLSEGLGSATGFLLLGLIAPEASIGQGLRTFSLTSGASGAVGQAGSMYADAKSKDLSESKALWAGFAGLPLGATEGFGVGSALNKALKVEERRTFAKLLLEFVTEGAEEGGQETIQNVGQDAFFQFLQDKDPTIYGKVKNVISGLPENIAKNFVDNGINAFWTGGIFGGAVQGVAGVAERLSNGKQEKIVTVTENTPEFVPVETKAESTDIVKEDSPKVEQKPIVGSTVSATVNGKTKTGTITEVKGKRLAVEFEDGSKTFVKDDKATVIEEIPAVKNSEQNAETAKPEVTQNQQDKNVVEQDLTTAISLPTSTPKKPAVVQGIQLQPRQKVENNSTVSNATEIVKEAGGLTTKKEEKSFVKDIAEAKQGKEGSELSQAVHAVIEDYKPSEDKSERKYSSTQVDFPEAEANEMRSFGKKFIKDEDLHEKGREDRPHFTAEFGLTTKDAERVRPLIEGFKPFKIKLGKTFIFENDNFDVVNVGIEDSKELRQLQQTLDENLRSKDFNRDFVPHAALAYVKKGEGKKYVGNSEMEGKEVLFNGLTFSGKDRQETFIPFGISKNSQKIPVSENNESKISKSTQTVDKNNATLPAHEAATSPTNDLPEPTLAQKEAGNYKKGHININGLNISVENPVGSQRKGVDRNGKAWSVKMRHHYGYIKRTVGADKENIDIFVKDNTPNDFAGDVYVVDQVHPDSGKFDEHKVMLGFDSEKEAREAYASNYAKDWKGLKSITAMSFDDFKKWSLGAGEQNKPAQSSSDLVNKDKESLNNPKELNISDLNKLKFSDLPTRSETKGVGKNHNLKYRWQEFTALDENNFERNYVVKINSNEEINVVAENLTDRGLTQKTASEFNNLPTNLQDFVQKKYFQSFSTAQKVLIARAIESKNPKDLWMVGSHIYNDRSPELAKVLELTKEDLDINNPNKLILSRLLDLFNANQPKTELSNSEIQASAMDIISELYDEVPQKFSGKNEKVSDALKGLADIFGDDILLKSVIPPKVQIDEAKYNQSKELFKVIVNELGNPNDDVNTTLRNIIQTLKNEYNFSKDGVVKLVPYMAKFIEESRNSLQNSENESIPKKEVNSDVEQNQSSRNDQGSDGNTGSSDVQRTEKVGNSERSNNDQSGNSDGNLLRNAQRQSGENLNDESRSARTDSGTNDAEQASDGVDNQSSDRVSRGNDYVAPVGTLSREGSWRETARRNLDIIELVKKLEKENRLATPEEQSLLVKFTGWGASEIANSLFPGYTSFGDIRPEYAKDGWKELATRAKEIFTPEELKTAASSTRNAHYTSEQIVRGIWDAVSQFGFSGGKVLEPGMGVGLFGVAAPQSIFKKSRYTGIERDSMTARIAKQILQNQAVLENDFVKQNLPDNFFDVAIGNPPFSDTKILNDPRYKKYRFMTHDYFFAKSIDKVRPGGILVFVTSKGTMDKTDPIMREYIAERADLLGAIRLPQTAFKENAGTEVVTDVLFFRKRFPDELASGENWITLDEITAQNKQGEEHTGLINEYFVNHPEMVLGEHSFQGSMYKANEYTVKPLDGDIEELFKKAIEKLPTAIYSKQAKSQDIIQKTAERDWSPTAQKEGSLYLHSDGRLMRREQGAGIELSQSEKIGKSEEKWLRDYVGLRIALKQAQSDQLTDSEENPKDWEKSLSELNRVYDSFVRKHGNILQFSVSERTKVNEDGTEITTVSRRFKNNKVLNFDVESPLVEALETITEDGQIVKSPMLLGRTIKPPQQVEIKELSDALAVSLDTIGKLNLSHVAELMQPIREGITKDDVIKELGDAIFESPNGEWQLADEYLSGFVIDKLEEAEAAAQSDSRFQRNVEALLKVQPQPIEHVDINASLGASWIGAKYTSDFANEVLGLRKNSVTFQPMTNTWIVEGADGKGSRSLREASNDWGTSERSPNELLDAALNNRTVKISYKDSEGRTHVDVDSTALANERIKKMRDAFRRWIWSDAKRAQTISEKYNRQFNNIAPRFFEGSHLSTPGLSSRYKLHPHQKRAVWRILQTGNTYLAHAVGAGKTLEMIVSGMEQKRLGLISKPMYVVPNHMLKQFSSEFLEAYPLANILVADENNFAKEKRKQFTAQAALNDLDAVIITHSAFGLIRTKQETADVVIDDMIDQMRMAIEELDENDRAEQRTIKDLENRIEKIRQNFGSLTDATGKDDVVSFEDLGVDFVYVDESHEFRKLDFVTNRTNVKGIDPKGSQRSLDLLIKLTWLETQRPGRSAVLASGTPITNTLAELYSIMRYLDPAELENAEMAHFDAWSAQFGEVVADYEMNAAGNYEIVERFSKFVNIPELMKRARKFMDVLTLSQLGSLISLPTLKGGQPEIVVVKPTEAQTKYLKDELASRIQVSRDWKPSKDQKGNPDPLINIITDGRLAAIDMRYVDPTSPNDPNSKLNVMIDKIIEKYNETKDLEFRNKNTGEVDQITGATQIIFSAVGFGDQVARKRGFDAKAWMIKRLTESGIPQSEIAFMSDYKLATAKERMFQEMRTGQKKILIGSPKNMGTGVNVQKRLKIEHYLSPPWYPADVEQPDGRIIRQGNQNEEIEIYRYATKGTYDSTAWAMIARKSRAIEQAMTGDDSQRSLEDISESSQYEMASAVSAGDDRAIKLAGLRRDIEKLERLRGAHAQEQRRLGYDKNTSNRVIENQTERIAKYDQALRELGTNVVSNDAFKITIGSQTFEKRTEMGDRIKSVWENTVKSSKNKAIKLKESVVSEIGKVLGKFPLIVETFAASSGIESRLIIKIADIKYDLTNIERGGLSISEIREVDNIGLSTRIYNSLNSIAKSKVASSESIEAEKRKIKQIESKIGQPFAEEQELYEKIAEYTQLQAEMAGEGSAKNFDAENFLIDLNKRLASVAIEKVINRYLDKNSIFNEDDFTVWQNSPQTLKSVLPTKGEYLAPNGEKSNLNPYLYNLVRTLEFKKWFGDWEKLFTEQQIEKITPVTYKVDLNRDFFEIRNEGIEEYKKLRQSSGVFVPALNSTVKFSAKGEGKSFSNTGDKRKFTLAKYLPELFKNSVLETSEKPKDIAREPSTRAYHRLTSKVEINGNKFYVNLLVREDNQGHFHYNHRLFTEEFGSGASSVVESQNETRSNTTVIEPNDLSLYETRPNFNKSNVSKVLDKNGEPLISHHGTRNDFDSFAASGLGGYFFTPNKLTASMIAGFEKTPISVFLNLNNPKIIRTNKENGLWEAGYDAEQIRQAKEEGYDGIIYEDTDGNEGYLVAFKPNQIKSLLNEGTFDNNDNSFLKQVLPEDLPKSERLTYEEIQTLPYVPFDELLGNAQIEQFGDKIKANPQSHEIFRRAFEEARIRAGQTKIGSKDAEDSFAGVFIKPDSVQNTIKILQEKASEAKNLGYLPQEIAVFTNHAEMLKEAAKVGKGTAIVYVFDKALPEELFHQADYLGSADKSILNRHDNDSIKKLDSHPITAKLWQKHFSSFNEYRRLSGKMVQAVLRAEIAPMLVEMSDADLQKYGITKDQRDDYLLTWFEGYANRNGIAALDNFEREELNVQEFIEKVKETKQIRSNGQTNETDSSVGQIADGETHRGPPSSGHNENRRLSSGGKSTEVENLSDDTKTFLGDNQKFASLPKTLRRAGIDADDIVYEVFGDKAAQASARKILEENGIEGSIRILREIKTPDVDHAILSFMIQRVLLDRASEISATNPEESKSLRDLALKLGREHALKAVSAGRFTRAASIVQNSVEGIMYVVKGVIEEKFGEDKTLSAEDWNRIENVARQAEEALAKVTSLQKEKISLERKIKRLETEKEAKKRKRNENSLKSRKKLVDIVKEKQNANIERIKRELMEQFSPAALKSIIGEKANLNGYAFSRLTVAKMLSDAKISSDEIYSSTGWEKGSDGKWRSDLNGKFELNHKVLRKMLFSKKVELLDSVIDAPELFSAYPELRNIRVAFERLEKGVDAAYNSSTKSIILNNTSKLLMGLGLTVKRGGLQTHLKHEIQHAIQEIENFTKGTNSQIAGFDYYWNKPGEVEARNAEKRLTLSSEEKQKLPISQTEDVSRQKQLEWLLANEPATLKSVLSDDGSFDEETLNKFAQVGAMYLTEGLASENEYLPDNFHADMLNAFGDIIGANFQEIYLRSWNLRDKWLSDIRKERTKESILKKFGEDLTDAEIDDILNQRKDVAARRRAVEQIHKLASQTTAKSRDLERLNEIIVDNAKDENEAVTAVMINEKQSTGEIYNELDQRGVEKGSSQRDVLRRASALLEEAKKLLNEENTRLLEEIAQTQKQIRDLGDLQWQARNASRHASSAIENELRRIKSGELTYRGGQIIDIANASRSLMASFDLSGAMRQGGYFTFAKPELQAKAFGNMFKSFAENGYGRAITEIENHPRFILAQRSGIDFAEAGKSESDAEEIYRSKQVLEKIPVLGKILNTTVTGWSERTYTAFLDTQRMVIFDVMAQELEASGLSIKKNKIEFEKVAEFINIATGRGNIDTNRIGKLLLAMPFFAPRYTLSRFQLLNKTLNPVAYYNMPRATRKIVAKSAVRFYGTTAAILFIPALLGLVSFDPDDDEFLKIKVGNTKYDIFAGLQQPAKMLLKLVNIGIRGERIPGEMWYDTKRTVGKFLQGKLAPLPSLGYDWLTNSDFNGNEFSWSKAIASRIMPITFNDVHEAYKLDGVTGVARSLPFSMFGIGVNNYAARFEKPRTEAEKLAAKAMAMKMASKPQTDEEREERKVIQELTARSRAGEDVSLDIDSLVKAGKLSKEKVGDILAAKDKTLLVDKAEGLSLDEFTAVYKAANTEEKKSLLPLLNKKMKNAEKAGNLSSADKSNLENLGGKVLGDFPMPDAVKTEFEKFGISNPDVSETISVKKGEKTKLSTEQYEKYRREALQKIYEKVQSKINSEAYQEADDTKREKMIREAINKGRSAELKETKKDLKLELKPY